MADINQIITLGIGTPSSIEHFILFGLNASGPSLQRYHVGVGRYTVRHEGTGRYTTRLVGAGRYTARYEGVGKLDTES